jgi:hypothetical protein
VFAYDGDNLVEETNSSGTVVARYSQGLNIDEPLAMLRSGATSFYHADGLGTITSLANTSGSLAQTYTFDSSIQGTSNKQLLPVRHSQYFSVCFGNLNYCHTTLGYGTGRIGVEGS